MKYEYVFSMSRVKETNRITNNYMTNVLLIAIYTKRNNLPDKIKIVICILLYKGQ